MVGGVSVWSEGHVLGSVIGVEMCCECIGGVTTVHDNTLMQCYAVQQRVA